MHMDLLFVQLFHLAELLALFRYVHSSDFILCGSIYTLLRDMVSQSNTPVKLNKTQTHGKQEEPLLLRRNVGWGDLISKEIEQKKRKAKTSRSIHPLTSSLVLKYQDERRV